MKPPDLLKTENLTYVTANARHPSEGDLAPGVRGHDEGRVLRTLTTHKVGVRCAQDGVDIVDQTNGTGGWRHCQVNQRRYRHRGGLDLLLGVLYGMFPA